MDNLPAGRQVDNDRYADDTDKSRLTGFVFIRFLIRTHPIESA